MKSGTSSPTGSMAVPAVRGVGDRAGGGAQDLLGHQAPDVQPDVRDVVAAGGHPAHLGGVGRHRERSADELEVGGPPQVGRAEVPGPAMGEVLRGAEPLEVLHARGGPAGELERQVLDRGQRALPPTVVQGVRDQRALPPGARPDRVQESYAEQVAEVGHDPVGAGLDEGVVVELREVGGDDVALLAQDLEECLEHAGLVGLRVALAVEPREQVGQLVAAGAS